MAQQNDPIEFLETFATLRRSITTLAAQTYATAGLGSTQAKFLRHIGQRSRISQAELARATETDPTLTGRALKTLIDRGLVRRKRSDEDKREYTLELSAAGRRSQEQAEKLRAQFAARVVGALTEQDLADFYRVSNKILVALGASTSEQLEKK